MEREICRVASPIVDFSPATRKGGTTPEKKRDGLRVRPSFMKLLLLPEFLNNFRDQLRLQVFEGPCDSFRQLVV